MTESPAAVLDKPVQTTDPNKPVKTEHRRSNPDSHRRRGSKGGSSVDGEEMIREVAQKKREEDEAYENIPKYTAPVLTGAAAEANARNLAEAEEAKRNIDKPKSGGPTTEFDGVVETGMPATNEDPSAITIPNSMLLNLLKDRGIAFEALSPQTQAMYRSLMAVSASDFIGFAGQVPGFLAAVIAENQGKEGIKPSTIAELELWKERIKSKEITPENVDAAFRKVPVKEDAAEQKQDEQIPLHLAKFRQLWEESSQGVEMDKLSKKLQAQFNKMQLLKLGEDSQQFTAAYLDFMDGYQKEMKARFPMQAKKLEEAIKMVKDGEVSPEELFKEFTNKTAKADDPKAVEDLQKVADEVTAAKKEGRNPDPNVLKKIDFNRIVKIFGIAILVLLGLLLFSGMSTGGAMAGVR